MKYLHIVGVLLPASKHGLQLSFLKVMQHVLAVLIFGLVYLLLERLFRIVVSNGYILGVAINFLQSSCLPFVEEVTDVSLHESQGHHQQPIGVLTQRALQLTSLFGTFFR